MASYDLLNPEQKEAGLHTEGPLLILAGRFWKDPCTDAPGSISD